VTFSLGGPVWSLPVPSADHVGHDPLTRPRQSHGGGVRRAISTAQQVMLVGLFLEPAGSDLVPTAAMVFGEALVAIEEEDVRL